MDPTNPSILRPIVYYEFLQGHSAREAANNICAAFKKDVVHHSTVSRWYHRFESGDISIEGQERPGHPSTLHDDDLRSALISKPNITTREVATTFGCSKSTCRIIFWTTQYIVLVLTKKLNHGFHSGPIADICVEGIYIEGHHDAGTTELQCAKAIQQHLGGCEVGRNELILSHLTNKLTSTVGAGPNSRQLPSVVLEHFILAPFFKGLIVISG
ncbi:unnamed protein product [Haemonchus placei]|uniref:HTH_48 domain-containing protein n=1 Tax=Haemonchus placei TaxID=6290 RepID=A0A0N4WWD3_HAEPC|nr:unnamed protein product [Haemonchus placei]